MFSKIKNILIFVVIAGVLIAAYIFFFKKDANQSNLTSSVVLDPLRAVTAPVQNNVVDTEFLSVLLSVKDIKLNDSMFANTTFLNLRDSSITLTPDGTEGRKNPFASIGIDVSSTPLNSLLPTQNTAPSITGPQADALKTPNSN